jgi:hypothetical protein
LHRIFLLITLVVCVSGCGPKSVSVDRTQFPTPFHELVSAPDWDVTPKDFEVSLQSDEKIFALRVQERHFLRFSIQPQVDPAKGESGPLQKEYGPQLSKLLAGALSFADKPKSGKFSLDVEWEQYLKSIVKWAQIWQASELRQNWDKLDKNARYKELMGMISRYIVQDMQPVLVELGFNAMGADMEKMSFQKAGQLKYYEPMLAQAGIPAEFEIPIPLMLYVTVQPSQANSTNEKPLPQPQSRVAVDYIFAVAKQNNAALYLSFHRSLDEYEVNGEGKQADGTFKPLLPMSRLEYQPMAAKLLQAAVRASRDDVRPQINLRLDLGQYPELEQEVIERFTLSPDVTQKTAQPRPGLPHLRFYTYQPLLASGFVDGIRPFLKLCGYKFNSLQINVDVKGRAVDHPEYKSRFKPLGIKPDDKLALPSIVYLVVDKE